jgi:hypothetical protein
MICRNKSLLNVLKHNIVAILFLFVYVQSIWQFASIIYTLQLQEPIPDVRTLQTSALESRDFG